MSIRKYLLMLNNKLEQSWRLVNFSSRPITLSGGWYIAEYNVQGQLQNVPILQIEDELENVHNRQFIGAHSGRNRMLIYLPEGRLLAQSSCLDFSRLARVSTLEARFRILLICARYLRDFPKLSSIFRTIGIQFQGNSELSNKLLAFYEPARGGRHYQDAIERWRKYEGFKTLLTWWYRRITIGVIVADASQINILATQIVAPDAIVTSEQERPGDIDYWIALNDTEQLRFAAILMFKQFLAQQGRKRAFKLIYTDHDYAAPEDDAQAGLAPVFKPQPSRAYLHCFNYVGFAFVVHKQLINGIDNHALFDNSTRYALCINAFSDTRRVCHLPEALFRSTQQQALTTPAPLSNASPWPNIQWLRKHDYNVLRADPAWQGPSVDLIIPTRDGLNVLDPCVASILDKTEYQNYKVIIVDNGSEQPATLDYFEKIAEHHKVSVVSYPGEFNYSAINNFAASQGNGDYVGLINNDIEVIAPDWLTQMMAWASQPAVGVVGAKLLFSNGKVQHAGVTIGMGNAAGHIHRLEPGDAPGYQLRCLATQNMMAVTAACLITPRDLFEQLGGLNETDFKVAYNDIDYCLRVEALGKDLIWTPEALLYHHESVSRGDDMSDQHITRYFRELESFQTRWKSKGFVDKYYSKHLRISDEGVFPQIERASQNELHYFE